MSRSRAAARAAPFLFLLALFLPGRASGYEFRLVPSAAVKEEYNDNIFFATSAEQDSFVTTLSPGLALTNRTERLDLSLSGVMHWIFYSELSELDDEDYLSRGNVTFRVTPHFRVLGSAGYRRDTRPDSFIETTGLAVTNRSKRQDYMAGMGWTPTDRTEALFSYEYEKIEYEDRTDADSESHGGSLTLIQDLERVLPRTKGRAGLGFTRTRYRGLDVENYRATLGFLRQVSELWSLLLDAGGRYTRSEFDVLRTELVPPDTVILVPGTKAEDGFGWVANASLMYRGDKNRGSLSFSRDVEAASGRDGATERTSAVLDIGRRFTYEFSGSLSAGYYRNTSEAGEFSTEEIDEKSVRVRPSLRYAFTRNVFLEAVYQYARIDYGASNARAEQNLAYLAFGVQVPLFE